MGVKPFAVVEFTKEGSVGVVHESWIESNPQTKTIYCYWPIGQPSVSITKKARNGEIPDKEKWSKQEIRIFCYAGTFTDALLRSKKAEDTSNVETEEEQEESGRRKRKAPRAFSNSDSESSPPRRRSPRKTLTYDEISRPSLPEAPKHIIRSVSKQNMSSMPKTPRSTKEKTHLYYDSLSDDGDDINADYSPENLDHSSPVLPTGSRSRTTTPASTKRQDKEVEGVGSSLVQSPSVSGSVLKLILTKLSILQQNQTEILSAIRNLTQRHVAENLDASAVDLDEICPKPAETEGELLDIDEKIKDEQSRKKLSQYYCTFGGKDVDTTCRLIMSFTGTNKVWSLYSLKGMRGKKKLNDMAICRPILNALMKTHKTSKKEAEDAVIEFLKHAPFRKGGLKFKKGMTGTSSGTGELGGQGGLGEESS